MKKIAYIHTFGSHPILGSVKTMLKKTFPEYEIEAITITNLLKNHPLVLGMNGFHAAKTYSKEIVKSPKVFRKRFLRTPFMFREVKRLVGGYIDQNRDKYVFSFQLHSLFDTSVAGLPHFVYTDHTYAESQRYIYRNTPYSKDWAQLEPEIYENANRIFTRSTNISRSVIDDYGIPSEKVACVYCGANVIKEGPRENQNYTNQNILFVGTDWELKGGPVLIEAFRAVLEKFPDAHLTIIGSDPVVDLPNCHVLGTLPQAQLDQYYRQASIFCLPTRREPFGAAFLEAMQYGLPIIGTNIGAIPDFIKDEENGYLVEPENVEELTKALIQLLGDPEKQRQFGENSCSKYEERYTWKRVGAAIRNEILSVL